MKSFKNIALLMILGLVSFSLSFAGTSKEVKIQTNMHCGSCKTKVEGALKKDDGIIKSNVDLKSNVVTLTYNPDKTTPEKLTKTIADLGFEANVMTSDTKKDMKAKDCDKNDKDCGTKNCCKTGTKKAKKG